MKTEKIVYKVSLITIIVNIVLTIIKLLSGIFGKSQAMISDSIHSLSDVLSTIVVIIGVKLSLKKPDKLHPYGHERIECVAAIILSIMLLITGIGIGYTGINNIIFNTNISIPEIEALLAAIISIIVKEIMFWYTKINANKINSNALLADAWHHRSDSLSSIGSLIGIIGARIGFYKMDSIASIIICIFIIKVAIDIFRDSIDKMIDKSCNEETIKEITNIINENNKVLYIDEIKTRQFGNKAYVDIEISVNEKITIKEAHDIAEKIHDEIEKKINIIKHCMIHVNPR